MKTDILKDAIAEADVIKKLAIDNAKASLNEAFDSKIKSMLAARLQEEADGDDDLEEKYDDEENTDELEEEDRNDDETDESFDIDAILAEMESEDDDVDEARGKKPVEPVEDEEDDENGMKKDDMKKPVGDDEDDMKKDDVDEEIDLDALIAEMVGEGDYSEDDDDDDMKKGGYSEKGKDGKDAMMQEEEGGLNSKSAAMLKDFKAFLIAKQGPKEEMPKKESIELQEIKRQAAQLAKKVNETNLINAKLLYLNKVLRNHNLSENQKLKVVAAFDRATSVKEAKIVYESLNEALNIKVGATKTSLKESLGFASKASGNSTKREIISEADSHVARWQHLAGIKKSN
jgi:hypothetical protein